MLGRDGLTHNMLDNIHAHWKRRRVCKIKCKGVCTVDMDNVRDQLEVLLEFMCVILSIVNTNRVKELLIMNDLTGKKLGEGYF